MIWKSKTLLVLLSCLACSLLAGCFTSLTAHAFEKITNYEKIYSDSFSVSSSNITWTKQGNTSIWIGTGNVQQSWTPQITFNKNITVEKGDIVVLNYTTILKQTTPDECSVGLSYWAVVDCYNEYETTTNFNDEVQLNMLGCNHKVQNPDGTWMCDEWKAVYNSTQTNPVILMRNKYYYTLRWQGETTTINNIRLGGVLFSRDAQENLPVLWSVGAVSFFRGGKGLTDIYNYLEQNDVNQGQQEAGQQAQQDGQTGADSSQQQAQQGGQTLLQGFSSFVGALTSASASDCVINGDIGDFKMGNMDLCQLSPPPAFQAISSIMVIGFVVPLSIATIRKFIGMFRSFQNG